MLKQGKTNPWPHQWHPFHRASPKVLRGWLTSHPPQEKGAGQMLSISEDVAPLVRWGRDLGKQTVKSAHQIAPSFCLPSVCPPRAKLCPYHLSTIQALGQLGSTRCKRWAQDLSFNVPHPLVPWMTVCLKSSSRSLGKKQSIRSQVISQRSEYPVRESALWNIPAVSITSSIFFRDSGMASSCNQRHSSGHRGGT